MARRLPPLYPLRTFEAAARHLGFTRAADELGLSQAAVSQQVKALETYLQTPLFQRVGRRLELTPAGAALLPAVRNALDEIASAVDGLLDHRSSNRVGVALAPHFAASWLTPRLARFITAHPSTDLFLIQRIRDVDFVDEGVDIAVRFGRTEDWPAPLVVEPLLAAPMTPVCSPAFLEAASPIQGIDGLGRFPLLNVPRYDLWRWWMVAAGSRIPVRQGTMIDDYNVLLRAAMDGQGFALGIKGLIEDYLETGRLVAPLDRYLETPFHYYLVYPAGVLARSEVRHFREWLLAEAGGSVATAGAALAAGS
jgi:LysR family glycine cleavage system transcriptional activator